MIAATAPSIFIGSSPRGRGTQVSGTWENHSRRIIPAWAGNTDVMKSTKLTRPDHPRVGGEHAKAQFLPRLAAGSSPRGRGTLLWHVHRISQPRIIPAWAGNTSRAPRDIRGRSDHPRVGGEHFNVISEAISGSGSSPRGRGTRRHSGSLQHVLRIIPAWAGNTLIPELVHVAPSDHPRVGGEHYSDGSNSAVMFGSSPRGRGTQARAGSPSCRARIIPAWAGNTMTSSESRA